MATRERSGCEGRREALVLWTYGELEPAEGAELQAHLASCAGCREELEGVRAAQDALDAYEVPDAPDGAWARADSDLERRIAPLRADRLAARHAGAARWRWPARVAAAFVAATLVGVFAVGYQEHLANREQNAQLSGHLSQVQFQVADLQFRLGEVSAAAETYRTLALRAGEPSDPALKRRLEALPRLLEEPERLLRLWAQARLSAGEEQRQRLLEICRSYPEHPFADEAFLALRSSSTDRQARLRPLETLASGPLSVVRPPAPGEDARGYYGRAMDDLLRYADSAPKDIEAFVRLRAARIAEEKLGDAEGAKRAYKGVLREAAEGPVRDAAEARLRNLHGGKPLERR